MVIYKIQKEEEEELPATANTTLTETAMSTERLTSKAPLHNFICPRELRYMPGTATTTTMATAMVTERSSSTKTPTSTSKAPLHNFTLPGELRWCRQKLLRCMEVKSDGRIFAIQRKSSSSGYVSSKSGTRRGGGAASNNGSRAAVAEFSIRRGGCRGGSDNDDDCASYYSNYENGQKRETRVEFRRPPPLPPEKRLKVDGGRSSRGIGEHGVGIAPVREKVMPDLQTAADRMKDAILGKETSSDDPGEGPPGGMAALAAAEVEEGGRPWNLRTRRATYRLGGGGGAVPANGGGCGGGVNNLKLDVIKPKADDLISSPSTVSGETTPRLRSGAAAAPGGEKKAVKFSVQLARREIEEDFMAMARHRHRPPRRPRKRPKYIEKQLDKLFPGWWLTEITADIYKVPQTQ